MICNVSLPMYDFLQWICKLLHSRCATRLNGHLYFHCFPRLWNILPTIDLDLPYHTLHHQLTKFFWTNFYINLSSDNACTYNLLCRCSACPQSSSFCNIWPLVGIMSGPSVHSYFCSSFSSYVLFALRNYYYYYV